MQTEKTKSNVRFLAGTFSTAVLVTCLAGALVVFGLPALRPASWENPFTWDAPTRTIARSKAIDEETGRSTSMTPVVNPFGETVILDDWNYTAIVRGRPQPSKHK